MVLLCVLLSVLLAAAAAGGVWLWASGREGPADLREGGGSGPVRLSLYEAPEPVAGHAPESVPAPDVALQAERDPYDIVEVIGQEDGLMVARILGKRYKGFIAVIDDPSRLFVATCPFFSDSARGRTVDEMVAEHGAVLGINGGGFADDGGYGNGAMPTGNVISDGVMRWAGGGSTVGMDANGKLHAGEFSPAACREMGLQWAVSYGPTLIVDGQIRDNLSNNQAEPRTAVGQRADGAVVLLNIQGRQVSALGVTCRELAEIMQRLGCVDAGNLDGGASADMYYRGRYVNISNISSGPRPLPTTVLVAPAGEEAAG